MLRVSGIILVLLALFSVFGCQGVPTAEAPPSSRKVDLQQLIDSTPDGKTLQIPSGEYAVDDSLLIRNRNDLTLIFAPGTKVICTSAYKQVVTIGNSTKIKIEGGYFGHKVRKCFEGVFDIWGSHEVSIENAEIVGCGVVGVSVEGCRKLTVTGCSIHDNSSSGLYLRRCDGVTIENCRIEKSEQSIDAEDVRGLRVRNNKMDTDAGNLREGLPVPFSVVKKDMPKQDNMKTKELVSIRLRNGKEIPIDIHENYDGSVMGNMGVDPGTIRVYREKGAIPLLHIEWCDFAQGMGAYQYRFFRIAREGHPTETLVSGIVPISGHWGAGTAQTGSYRVQYDGSVLTVIENEYRQDQAESKRPLYHEKKAHGSKFYEFIKEDTLTRTYKIGRRTAQLKEITLRYRVQAGDTIEDVCAHYEIDKAWIVNPKAIRIPGSYLKVQLPLGTAGKWIAAAHEK